MVLGDDLQPGFPARATASLSCGTLMQPEPDLSGHRRRVEGWEGEQLDQKR